MDTPQDDKCACSIKLKDGSHFARCRFSRTTTEPERVPKETSLTPAGSDWLTEVLERECRMASQAQKER